MDAEGRFLSHAVSGGRVAAGQSRRRRKREVGEGNDEWEGHRGAEENREYHASQERLYYNVTVFGREFHLRLHHNARLVAPGAKMEWHDDSDSIRYSEPLHDECLYVGDITDTPGGTVALSNCDGLVSGQAVVLCVTSGCGAHRESIWQNTSGHRRAQSPSESIGCTIHHKYIIKTVTGR